MLNSASETNKLLTILDTYFTFALCMMLRIVLVPSFKKEIKWSSKAYKQYCLLKMIDGIR